jgi:hypothetical protein
VRSRARPREAWFLTSHRLHPSTSAISGAQRSGRACDGHVPSRGAQLAAPRAAFLHGGSQPRPSRRLHRRHDPGPHCRESQNQDHRPLQDRGQAQRDTAGRKGRLAVSYQIGDAKPGYTVTVDVAVRKGNRLGTCTTYFTPRRQPRPAAPPAASTPPSSAAPAPQGCYPRASSGNCYEPGEFCPHADAGMTGVAGDGKTIICEDNDGLRWEPA